LCGAPADDGYPVVASGFERYLDRSRILAPPALGSNAFSSGLAIIPFWEWRTF
jgi:hypothetical protein